MQAKTSVCAPSTSRPLVQDDTIAEHGTLPCHTFVLRVHHIACRHNRFNLQASCTKDPLGDHLADLWNCDAHPLLYIIQDVVQIRLISDLCDRIRVATPPRHSGQHVGLPPNFRLRVSHPRPHGGASPALSSSPPTMVAAVSLVWRSITSVASAWSCATGAATAS